MPERPTLPTRPYPLVLPPSGGFDEAIRRGRRLRRRRAAGVGGAAMTLVVGALGASLLRAPQGDVLRPADDVNPTEAPRPPRRDDLLPSTPALVPPPPRALAQVPGRPSASAPVTPADPKPKPSPVAGQPKPVVSQPVAPAFAPKPEAHWNYEGTQGTGCLPTSAVEEWCDSVSVTLSDNRLEYRLCPLTDTTQGPVSLRFRTEQHIELVIKDEGGQEVWRWSMGQQFGPPTAPIEIDRDECVRWRVIWDRTDDYGRNLPRGRYSLTGSSRAVGLESRPETKSYDFDL